MKSIIISKKEEGVKLDKYLFNLLENASKGLIYKQLRKKNITLNGKKDDGKSLLKCGDEIKIFFSDDTYDKLTGISDGKLDLFKRIKQDILSADKEMLQDIKGNIIYEDENVIFLNKKAGVLSQKAEKNDISINEMVILYLYEKGELREEDLLKFKPSVTNRLDRNTSGLITVGKSSKGLRVLSKAFKERTMEKYYYTIVKGEINEEMLLSGSLNKDNEKNIVSVNLDLKPDNGKEILTKIYPVEVSKDKKYSLVKIELLTGKTHQIRAHLSSINHPIIGDLKYGDSKINKDIKNKHDLSFHLLHSYSLRFNECDLKELNNKEFICDLPDYFERIWNDLA